MKWIIRFLAMTCNLSKSNWTPRKLYASACGHIDGTVAIATPGAPPTPCADEEGALKIECQRLAKELTDVKRKFVVATKRMQQEAAAK